MTKNKKIIIIGGDTVALAVNFVLSQQGYDTTVVSPHAGKPENLPYANGAARHHGISDVLTEALEYFDIPYSDEYKIRNASIIDGVIAPMTRKSLKLPELIEFHKKSMFVDRVRPVSFMIRDTELQCQSQTIRFDIRQFSKELHDFASPIVGTLDTINYSDGDICVRLEDGSFGCIEFDKLLIMEPPSELVINHQAARSLESEELKWPEATQNRIVRVSNPGFMGLEFECFYPFGTQAIHRFTFNDGLYVCESNVLHSLESVVDDINLIFGDGTIESIEIRPQHGSYRNDPSFMFSGWSKIHTYGKQATGNWNMHLADSMNIYNLEMWLSQ